FPRSVPNAIRLHLNEPAFEPSPRVIQAIQAAAASVRRYPDAISEDLTGALATRLQVDPARLVLGNGSDELLSLIGIAFLDPGSHAIYPTPAFPRYAALATLAGADAAAVPVCADGANDVAAMLAAIRPETRVVICSTPNNPTGAMLDADALTRLIEATPATALLVVDEAYFEFGREAGGCDALAALALRAGPWLSLRTFSKAYALAGLRVGYAISSSAAVAECLQRVRNTFNIGRLAQVAAVAALADESYMRAQVAGCAGARDKLAGKLAVAGLPCLPSSANFLAVDCKRPAADVVPAMAAQGYLVSAVGPAPFARHIRLGIGTDDVNELALATLIRICGSL
ncbi:MAG: aminotransferase class I/II-fold pyridoxal phosphate-dependent enzyme, partial [Lautropia sp.]